MDSDKVWYGNMIFLSVLWHCCLGNSEHPASDSEHPVEHPAFKVGCWFDGG